MKVSSAFFVILFFFATAAVAGEQSGVVANLEPALQQALHRDAACVQPAAFSDQDFFRIPVKTEEIHSGGRDAGIIAAPQDPCHCEGDNCATFVYLKSGESYKLAFENRLASLHPMKIVKHGLPSLSGKLQVSPIQEETTVYDWNGQEYQPSLCATVIRRPNQKLPSITRHACAKAVRTVASR